MTGDFYSDADNLNLISNIFKKINRKLKKSCLYLDFTLIEFIKDPNASAVDRSCFIDVVFHEFNNGDARWIRVDIGDLLSYSVISFVNSSSYDYLRILNKHYSALLEVTDRVKNHEFDMFSAARNASPPWDTSNMLDKPEGSSVSPEDLY